MSCRIPSWILWYGAKRKGAGRPPKQVEQLLDASNQDQGEIQKSETVSGGQGAADGNSVVETGANEEGTSADSYYETPPVESCVDRRTLLNCHNQLRIALLQQGVTLADLINCPVASKIICGSGMISSEERVM